MMTEQLKHLGITDRLAGLGGGDEDRPHFSGVGEQPCFAHPCGCRVKSTGVSSNTSRDRKSTRLNSSHANISYAVFCLKKKTYIYRSPVVTGDQHRRRGRVGEGGGPSHRGTRTAAPRRLQ